MADRLDHVIDECLELLRQGVPLELCLARYPEQRPELEPVLRTALTAQAELTRGMPAQLRTRVRDRVMAEWDRQELSTKSRAGVVWLPSTWRRRWLIAVPAASLLVAALVVAYVTYSGGEMEAPAEVARQTEAPAEEAESANVATEAPAEVAKEAEAPAIAQEEAPDEVVKEVEPPATAQEEVPDEVAKEAEPPAIAQEEVPAEVAKEAESQATAQEEAPAEVAKETETSAALSTTLLTVFLGKTRSSMTQWTIDLKKGTMTRVSSSLPPLTAKVVRGLDLVGVALAEETEAPLAGVYVHGNYAYVGGMSVGYATTTNVGIRILDISDPTKPELVGRIPLRTLGFFEDHSHGDAVATHIDTDAFQGDIAIVFNGVPDEFGPEDSLVSAGTSARAIAAGATSSTSPGYPQPYGIWDVTDPSSPQLLSVLNIGKSPAGSEGGDLGDKPRDKHAVVGNYFYLIYNEWKRSREGDNRLGFLNDVRVAVVDLSDPRRPRTVGEWQDTENPSCLPTLSRNKAGTRLYVIAIVPLPCGSQANRLHLYVLDIQNPTQPVEIGRYVYPINGVHSPDLAPNDDDTLLVLADGAWGKSPCGQYGRLHFLDISDLSAIQEVGTFKIEESDTCFSTGFNPYQATDVAVKGNLVYSTWLGGGFHVVDISDPANPVAVGEFRSPDKEGPWLSDVDLYSTPSGDYALASTVWGSGLYIIKVTDNAP